MLASQPIYQFYAELSDYTPKIWRRFQVFGNITMARLGYIVMTLYEIQEEHLFQMVYPIQENFERELPRVLEGEGYGIIEDCGGSSGLERIAEVFQKKSGDEYESLRAWLGRDDLDLSSFDLADMNFRLKKVPRIYRDLYEFGFAPTQQSINLLERKYLNSNKSVKE